MPQIDMQALQGMQQAVSNVGEAGYKGTEQAMSQIGKVESLKELADKRVFEEDIKQVGSQEFANPLDRIESMQQLALKKGNVNAATHLSNMKSAYTQGIENQVNLAHKKFKMMYALGGRELIKNNWNAFSQEFKALGLGNISPNDIKIDNQTGQTSIDTPDGGKLYIMTDPNNPEKTITHHVPGMKESDAARRARELKGGKPTPEEIRASEKEIIDIEQEKKKTEPMTPYQQEQLKLHKQELGLKFRELAAKEGTDKALKVYDKLLETSKLISNPKNDDSKKANIKIYNDIASAYGMAPWTESVSLWSMEGIEQQFNALKSTTKENKSESKKIDLKSFYK